MCANYLTNLLFCQPLFPDSLSVPQFLSLYRKYLYINELMGVVTEFFQRSGKKLSILKVPTFEFGE
jgi:hypothetical protein